MKIIKLLASIVLLGTLTVSVASAATVGVDYLDPRLDMSANNTYLAFDPAGDIVVDPGPVGTSFTHTYDFNVTDLIGLSAQTWMNVSAGASSIANLTFDWGTGGSVATTDAFGVQNGPISFTRHLAFGWQTLTVTGLVIGNLSIGTAYDFSIITTVPVPAAFWLFGSALVGFIGFGRRRASMQQA